MLCSQTARRTAPPAPSRPLRQALAAALASAAGSQAAQAAPPPLSAPYSAEQGEPGAEPAGFLSSLQRSNFLLGDLFGVRTLLSRYGVSFALQETSEILGNPVGGARRGAAYDGLTQAILQLDTQRAFGLYGGLLDVSALQIHGRNLSADNLLSVQTASGIEADRATRLWELWYQQKFLEDDRLDVKIGQQSADQEFIASPNGAYFVNTMFGWPVVPSYDLPGGGPAYPLSAPGLRLRYRPVNPLAVLVGAFSGSPARTDGGDPQRANPSGTTFPFNKGPLVFVELQYTYPALGSMVEAPEGQDGGPGGGGGGGAPLGHTYKLGAWYDRETFGDLRLDGARLSLAAPGAGAPLRHQGSWSVYAVADQMIWRQAANPNRSASVFGRAMGTPQGDRNLVDFSVNGGIVFHAPFVGRPDDTVALGLGYARVSGAATALDRDAAAFDLASGGGAYLPVRGSETFLEAAYVYQLRPWCQLQPDAQYVFTPGGGVADPLAPAARVGNELVLGLRTNVLF